MHTCMRTYMHAYMRTYTHAGGRSYRDLIMEIDILMSIGSHPNLVPLIGACIEDKKRPIILEEFIGGPNLATYFLMSHFCLKRPTIYSWIMDLMRAMEHLHSRDPVIMHRDVKPANCVLSPNLQTLKLCDFGMSKMCRRSQMATTVHTGYTGVAVNVCIYMAVLMFICFVYAYV